MVLPELRNLRLSTGKTVQELAQVLNVDEMFICCMSEMRIACLLMRC